VKCLIGTSPRSDSALPARPSFVANTRFVALSGRDQALPRAGGGRSAPWQCAGGDQAYAAMGSGHIHPPLSFPPPSLHSFLRHLSLPHVHFQDVASGCETEGRKDLVKIKAFVENALAAE
jgi:hypothetical protein